MQFQYCGASRPAGYAHEKNDCVVRAIAYATGLPYDDVHMTLCIRGRKDGRGAFHSQYGPVLDKYCDQKLDVEFFYGMTLHQAATSILSKGTWVVTVRGHMTVLEDGKQIDFSRTPKCRIQNAWRIKKP